MGAGCKLSNFYPCRENLFINQDGVPVEEGEVHGGRGVAQQILKAGEPRRTKGIANAAFGGRPRRTWGEQKLSRGQIR